ncbi:hypothetical protein PRZ48_011318, partial [Zasmidium cellare]
MRLALGHVLVRYKYNGPRPPTRTESSPSNSNNFSKQSLLTNHFFVPLSPGIDGVIMLLLNLAFLGLAAAIPVATNTSNASNTSHSAPIPVEYYGAGLPSGIKSFSAAGFQDTSYGPSRGGQAKSVSGIIEVQASTTHNAKLSQDMIPQNQTALTALFLSMFTPPTKIPSPEFTTVQGTFKIGASLCVPADATSPPTTVEFLTHGTGFDRFYWDFASGYSYVGAAVAAGHSVLIYDRLGNGASDHPDPLIVQAPIQVEIAHSLISFLRNGSLSSTTFTKVIAVGHSFGSGLVQALNVHYPTLVDASVLTGFSANSTAASTLGFDLGGNPTTASIADPQRFGDLPLGYMVPASPQGNQIQFFSFPGFDPSILTQVNAQKGTQAIGELFSPMIGGPVPGNYTAPLAVISGQQDFAFCQGNCSYPVDQAAAVKNVLYEGLDQSKFASHLVENAGHGWNLHYSAQSGFEWIQEFLRNQ